MATYIYKTKGTCSREMQIDYEGDTITGIRIIGGCSGNLSGISKLVTGMKLEDVANKLEGTKCGPKATSCPDQLAIACREILALNK